MRRLIPHFTAVAVILGCIALTRWQLDRAEEKRLLLEREASRVEQPLADLREPFDLPQPVRAVGRWLPETQILLDNRIREHQSGVFVLTPLLLEDGRVFLVNRGWAAWPSRDAPLPDPRPAASATVEVTGVLAEPPGVGVRIGEAASSAAAGWPRLQAWYDPTPLAAALNRPVSGAVIRLTPEHPDHLTGDAWQPVSFGPERHRGYALTWATIAFVVGLIWLGLSLRRVRSTRSR